MYSLTRKRPAVAAPSVAPAQQFEGVIKSRSISVDRQELQERGFDVSQAALLDVPIEQLLALRGDGFFRQDAMTVTEGTVYVKGNLLRQDETDEEGPSWMTVDLEWGIFRMFHPSEKRLLARTCTATIPECHGSSGLLSLLPFELLEDPLNVCPQLWNVVPHCLPHNIQVHTEILVNQLVAHSRKTLPGNAGMGGTQTIRNILHRLANDLKVAHDSVLRFDVIEKRVATVGCVVENTVDCIPNMEQVEAVVFHSGTASA